MDENPVELPKLLGNGKFNIESKLGGGSFGEVHVGKDVETGDDIAVKFEDLFSGFLDYEITVLKKLQSSDGQRCQGFARLLYTGIEGGNFRCIVMERLGCNLLQHLRANGCSLSTQTTVVVAIQAIACLEYLHSKRFIHRDVKPENFCTGFGGLSHHIFLVDFGLATEYYDGRGHWPLKSISAFNGNFRFASLNAHRCVTQSRRDDLEALAYMLIFLTRGTLPWSGVPSDGEWQVKNRRILEIKEQLEPGELGKGLPEAFEEYLTECRELSFTERPDYEYLSHIFDTAKDELSEKLGAPIKDHDVEWVDCGSYEGSAYPIHRREPPTQPDDGIITKSIRRAISKGSTVSRKLTLGPVQIAKALTEKSTTRSIAQVANSRPRTRWQSSCLCGTSARAVSVPGVCGKDLTP